MLTLTITPTTLEQLKALMAVDLSPFIDPVLTFEPVFEPTAGELSEQADAEQPTATASAKGRRGPGRPRKDEGAQPQAQTAPEAPVTTTDVPPAASAAPPAVQTAGTAPGPDRAAVAGAMNQFMQAGGTPTALRNLVLAYAESGALSQVPMEKYAQLKGDIELAMMQL